MPIFRNWKTSLEGREYMVIETTYNFVFRIWFPYKPAQELCNMKITALACGYKRQPVPTDQIHPFFISNWRKNQKTLYLLNFFQNLTAKQLFNLSLWDF